MPRPGAPELRRSLLDSVKNLSEVLAVDSMGDEGAQTGWLQRRAKQSHSCGLLDVAFVVATMVCGCGMVLGMAYLLYPGGFVCQTRPEAGTLANGGRAALITLIGAAPLWGRNTLGVSLAYMHRRPVFRASAARGSKNKSVADGWVAIVGGKSTWALAREARGLSACQALLWSLATLLFWHWSQPAAYFLVLEANKCYPGFMDYDSVGPTAILALTVAAREALYVLSTLLALLACPAFLLLDPVTAWKEADTAMQQSLRLAAFVIAPHNFVLLCLANCFRSWRRVFLSLVGIQVVADFASCFALGMLWLSKIHGADVPPALMIGFTVTAFGFVVFFGPVAMAATVASACDRGRSGYQRSALFALAISQLLALLYLIGGFVLLCLKIDPVCIGYTFQDLSDCHGQGGHLGLQVRINNNSSQKLFLIGDQKTTIRSYKTDMARFSGADAHPFMLIEAGDSVEFTSQGDFLSTSGDEQKNAGVTFWVASACTEEGHCEWNADRTQGAVLEWNMYHGTLYYDLSAVEAMDHFKYTMASSCHNIPPQVCSFDMNKCPATAPNAKLTAGGVTYCNAPKRVCLADDLGGTEGPNSCTDGPNPAMCTVWGQDKKGIGKVFYQEYAQTAACGCRGCDTHEPDGSKSSSSATRCKTEHSCNPKGDCQGLDGCKALAVEATPFVKAMREGCPWGYAYPFDDQQGGFSCAGAKTLEMTIDDSQPRQKPDDANDGKLSVMWQIVFAAVCGGVSLLLVGESDRPLARSVAQSRSKVTLCLQGSIVISMR